MKAIIIFLSLILIIPVFLVQSGAVERSPDQGTRESETETEDIRDIKGPVGFPSRIKPVLIFLLITGIIAAIVFACIKLRKRKKTDSIIPARPPHEIAYERLNALKATDLVGKGRINEFYTELSDIVRHYLEDRFVLKAPEMTTEEFLVKLKDSGDLQKGHKSLLSKFLAHCDLVKFARYGPTPVEIRSSFGSAEKLVDETKAVILNSVST